MTSGGTEPSAGRRWDRLVDFVSRGNGRPGGVHVPLSRLGLPGRAWRLLTWALAVADLVALTRTMWACLGFFLVFLLLWLVHTRYWAAAAAVVVFGVGIAVALFVQGEKDWWQAALVTVLVCLVTGTWVTRVQMARADLMTALADKERAMEALARTQGELAAAEHAAGAAAERERWAREVHDTLAQGFVSVVALSQAARAEMEEPEQEGGPALHERLAQIEEVSRDNLVEARALVAGRGPSALSSGGLDAALRRLAQAQGRRGVEVSLCAPAPADLPPALQVVVLRLVQEALSNVVRHARAERADVLVSAHDGELVVVVGDDGVGAGGAPEGTGLTGMRSRVESLGGTLAVAPLRANGPGGRNGTVIEARMPL